ncbi:MAG TPA: lysylphosphatidylglycerol synthase transmembrane domain-containing protein [Pseudonocardiaceae bacterium]|nr:lysylphosphatidylglycerol synthase transmembrane domain-containing protein [Pseudonocardiaceae bacterium]
MRREQVGRALRRSWPWLRIVIAVGLLAILAWRVGTGAFVDGLKSLSVPAILAALGIGVVTTVFSAWRWRVVAHRLELDLTMRRAVADYYRALFLNVVLPTGVLGDVQRAVRHGQTSGDVGRGVRAVVLERAGGQIVLFALCVALLLVQPSIASAVVRDVATSPVVAILVGLLIAAVVVAVLWGRRRSWWGTVSADVRTGLLARNAWPAVVLLSAVVLAGHLALFWVAARTAGVTAPVTHLITPVVLTLLASGLPVNIGGWGPRESVSVLAFQVAGLGATQGLTVAVVYGVLTFAGSLPGAVVLLVRMWQGRRSRPKVELEEGVVVERETADRGA